MSNMQPCGECGMPCNPAEYHPFAACLMFKACHDSAQVRANLDAVVAYGPPTARGDDWTQPHPPSRQCMCPACIPSFDDRFAPVESDARDAARYRWLRERNAVLDDVGIFTAVRIAQTGGAFSHNDLVAGAEMDAAIDAAMTKPSTPGEGPTS